MLAREECEAGGTRGYARRAGVVIGLKCVLFKGGQQERLGKSDPPSFFSRIRVDTQHNMPYAWGFVLPK